METRVWSSEQRYEDLLRRVDRAVKPPKPQKDNDGKPERKRERSVGNAIKYVPPSDIDIQSQALSSAETTVLFLEATRNFKFAPTNRTANRWLARSVDYANKIASEIRGDDEGVRFYNYALAQAEENFPELSTDMGVVLDAAFDRRIFERPRR